MEHTILHASSSCGRELDFARANGKQLPAATLISSIWAILWLAVARLRYSQKAAVKKKYHCWAFVPVIGRPSGPPPRRASLNSSRHMSTWVLVVHDSVYEEARVCASTQRSTCSRVTHARRMTSLCDEGLYTKCSRVVPSLQPVSFMVPCDGHGQTRSGVHGRWSPES